MIAKTMGKIKQVRNRHDKTKCHYIVTFMGNFWRKKFDNFSDAKVYAEMHARSIIAEKQIRIATICFERANGRKSYITYNGYLTKEAYGLKAVEYEESAFDYYDTLFWHEKYWKKAQQVNESKYNNDDILRSGLVTSKPIVLLQSFLFFILTLGVLILFLALIDDFANKVKHNEWAYHLSIYTAIASDIAAFIVFVSSKHNMLKIIRLNFDSLSKIHWKEIYHSKKIVSFVQILLLVIFLGLGIVLAVEIWPLYLTGLQHNELHILLITIIGLGFVQIIIVIFSVLNIYWKISKNLNDLYDRNEILSFRKWLRNRIGGENFNRANPDFFGIPMNISQPYVDLEKIVTYEFLVRESKDELDDYKRMSLKHLKQAIKQHKRIMSGKEARYNERIQKNNK